MTYAGTTEPDALVTRTGGVLLASAGTAWPSCAACGGPMQFLAQVLLDDLGLHAGQGPASGRGVLALFMCQNDPGMCDEWDPRAGGNRALLCRADVLRPIPVPAPDEHEDDQEAILLGAVSTLTYETLSTTADYDQAHEEWTGRTDRRPEDVLGRLGGRPAWIQNDETPTCTACAQPMPLVVQLEEGRDHTTAMNFGGCGMAYAFACEPCAQAVFLWQC
jgi:hypothetical protein